MPGRVSTYCSWMLPVFVKLTPLFNPVKAFWMLRRDLTAKERRQRCRQRMRSSGGEDHLCAGASGAIAAGTEQLRDPPRDRGRGIDPFSPPRRQRLQPLHQQRKMRAGQYHGIGADGSVAVVFDET